VGRLRHRGPGRNRAAGDDGAIVELAVVLTLLMELNGVRGLWRWQRAIEILHGSGARPERHNDPIQQLLALFQRARVSFDDTSTTEPATWSQLVVLERSTRSSATVHLDPGFHRELAAVTYAVPAEAFRIGPPTTQPDPKKPDVVKKVANPEGNLPSRRARARVRVGLMLKVAPRRSGEKPKAQLATELEQLVVDAGGDVERVKRRRHLQPWGLALKDELETAGKALGVGLVWFRDQVGSILRTILHIGRPAAEESCPPDGDVPETSGASRAPP